MIMKSLFLPFCLIGLVAAPFGAAAQTQTSNTSTATAVGAAVGTSGTAPVTLAPDYQLGSGDKIRVEVYKEPQLSQSLQVRPDGKITMPLIGDMTAAGLTPAQLRDQIGTALKDYLNNPVVSVIVVDALASTVYVMGEVNKPGTIALTGPTTVVQALAMAGGFKDFAKTGDIRILRQGPRGVDTLHFNYDDAVKGKGKMIYLQRGDTVIVR
jgi:polysaccharide export outer membrane protein